MLKLLRIENIILIDSAQIPFERGLNILSGETGAGKSAVMQALRLLSGEKGDPRLIRHGAEKGTVEALFELPSNSPIWEICEKAGLSFDTDEPLIIRRELSLQGKTRAFVAHQIASLPLLKELGEALFDIASQHASQKLVLETFQRAVLDTWGSLEEEVKSFGKSWDEEKNLSEQLETLLQGEAHRLREIEICTHAIEEIEEAKLSAGEDEALFNDYAQLATSEERFSKSKELYQEIHALPLSRIKGKLADLQSLDPSLTPLHETFAQTKLELEELSYALGLYQSRISFDPEKMTRLDERLKTIHRLKKKYGATLEAILSWHKEQKIKLESLLSSDVKIEELRERLADLKPKNEALALALSAKRRKAAKEMEVKITSELQLLNMPKAVFFIEVFPSARTKWGEDRVLFLFQPHLGGKKIEVKEAASGGELARILLAIKTLLSDKTSTGVLVFDEVDANIGGETARLLGEKLHRLGESTQVIAITHFPQVASQAHHHLRVEKIEEKGQTSSKIRLLGEKERGDELARMIGAGRDENR